MKTVLALLLFATPASASGLTSPEPLAKAYELILDARFDEAQQQLKTACGPAPQVGCAVMQAVAEYWQILLDPENTSRDQALLAKSNAAIAAADAWAVREPARAEAWFYVGGAYGTRVLLKGMLRDEMLAAARDGRRIHDALEQTLKLDSSLQDAYFGLGLYHYYAAIAPTLARVLRVLLMLPAGDRAAGLREMQQTGSRGMLLRGEADYQLHLIYLWYEHQPLAALKLVQALQARYPHNPIFAERIGIIQADYLKDTTAAAATYRALLDNARGGRVAAPARTEVVARLGLAQQMDALCDSDHAIEQLHAVIDVKPAVPYAALARAYYVLGLALDHRGRRADAIAAYQHALAAIPRDDRLQLAQNVRDRIKTPALRRICG